METTFYEWLLAELPEAEKVAFCKTLDTIYRRSKQERAGRGSHITAPDGAGRGSAMRRQLRRTGSAYFRAESGVLAVITVTGLLYNIGLVAGPWFGDR